MKSAPFADLLASVKEGGATPRGKARPSRTFVAEGPDVKWVRARYRLSQNVVSPAARSRRDRARRRRETA